MNREYREWFCYVLLSVVLFMAEFYFSPLFGVLFLISPLPFMLLQYRFGTRSAMYAALTAVLSIYLPDVFEHGMAGAVSQANLVSVLMFVTLFVFTGMLFGTLARLQKSAAGWLLQAIAASLSAKIFLMVSLIASTGINPFAIDEAIATSVVSAAGSVANIGSVQAVKDYVQELAATMKMLLPSMLILYAAADSFCTYKAAEKLLKRKGETLPAFIPFGEWRFPKELSTAVLAALLLKVSEYFAPSYAVTMASENLMMVLRAVFTLEGMSVFWYLAGKNRIFKALRLSLLVFSILFLALFTYPYSFVGIVDIWYDLRRLGGKKNESNS
ncbi:MAG: DUF2232 domain-containing protein [Synergistaceae bacterium]|nr:DUF2232 domain-containing protein [Candidatus Equadaptatus faecalis]